MGAQGLQLTTWLIYLILLAGSLAQTGKTFKKNYFSALHLVDHFNDLMLLTEVLHV